MTQISSITAELRDRAGKGAARATRRAGRMPAVIYGEKQAPTLISVLPKVMMIEMRKPGFMTRLFDIDLGDGRTERALARDVQLHPVTDQPLHADFLRVSADTVVHVDVPVHLANEAASPGLKRGGVLNIVRHTVEVICRPDAIPNEIRVDLTGLEIGDSVHISAITLPEGVRPAIADRDFTIISLAAPTVVKAGAGEGEGGEG